MQKYSENPLDNLQGYLENIERVVEELATKSAGGNSTASDSEKIAALKEDVSSISATIRSLRSEIKSEINTLSDAVNTVAAAIGTVPTEEERKNQHENDLKYIVENSKKQVSVGLDPSAQEQIGSITMQVAGLADKLQEIKNSVSDVDSRLYNTVNNNLTKQEEGADAIVRNLESRMANVVEKKANKALNKASASVIENWVWRVLTTVGVIAWFITWLYPKIEDIEFPNGVEGFFYTVLGVISITFILWGTYQWGKNSRGW